MEKNIRLNLNIVKNGWISNIFNTFTITIDGMLQRLLLIRWNERHSFDTSLASGYKFSASDCEKLVEKERLAH